MAQKKNLLNRVMNALIEARENEARHYVERFERQYGKFGGPVTKR